MKLIIGIPEELYDEIISDEACGLNELTRAIANGTPLPKGHGRLVDLDQMRYDYWDGNYMEIHFDDLDNIKTIIEADTGE